MRERCWTSYLQCRDDVGLRTSSAHCHFVSKLYRCVDKRETACEPLAIAMAMSCDMSMTYWLAQAEAEMRDLA